ncbi:MAG TPA: hypothetical protein DGT23_01705 [Micromonosporaceae bacterium]|nr:hypothetical protein [Micromonosporaceae bacterium]
MELLACGHVALPGPSRMCEHLLGTESSEHIRLLTGHGVEYNLCCRACDAAARKGQSVELCVACEVCVASCIDDDWCSLVAWRSTPGITDSHEPFDTSIVDTQLPVAVVDFAVVDASTESVWLLLDDSGRIGRFHADADSWEVLAQCTVPDEPDHEPWAGRQLRRRLHVSRDGRFAAVVNDFGHHGQVLDLHTGATTSTLNGGDYRPDTVPFSVAFTEHHGRTVVVHRTAWNWLDITDAATGRLLTARTFDAGEPGRPPEHHLDYFHGALYLSPDGRYVADDGWVWHPVGMPTVWDLRRWLDGNVWEAEDGPSRNQLCLRAYHWNSPMCWIGQEKLAISGIGADDEAMLAGVRIFDAASGVEMNAFAGPHGDLFADAHWLYSAAPQGLEVWDPANGHRLGSIPGFTPTRHHKGAGELACVDGNRLRRWRTPHESLQ